MPIWRATVLSGFASRNSAYGGGTRTIFLRPAFTAANYYDKLRPLELDVRITVVHVSLVTNRICHVFRPRELFYGERDVNKRSMISV